MRAAYPPVACGPRGLSCYICPWRRCSRARTSTSRSTRRSASACSTRDPGPGAKLSLHELATELGVSRSPVHHALTRLVSEGLLTVKARRGYYVTPVTPRRAWATGTTSGSRSSCTRPSARSARVDAHGSPTSATLHGGVRRAISHEEWDAANAAFHEFQIDLAGNEMLSRVYRELSVNLMMQVIRGGRRRGRRVPRHRARAIVDGIRGKRPRRGAARRSATHIESGKPHRARRDRARRRRALSPSTA